MPRPGYRQTQSSKRNPRLLSSTGSCTTRDKVTRTRQLQVGKQTFSRGFNTYFILKMLTISYVFLLSKVCIKGFIFLRFYLFLSRVCQFANTGQSWKFLKIGDFVQFCAEFVRRSLRAPVVMENAASCRRYFLSAFAQGASGGQCPS